MIGARPLSRNEIEMLVGEMRKTNTGVRDSALFLLGINTGFRISELLSLTVGNVLDTNGKIKDNLVISRRFMKGTKRSRSIYLSSGAKRMLTPLLTQLRGNGYFHKNDSLFQSTSYKNKAISRTQSWRILKRAAKKLGLPGNISSHSMRKTYSNRVYGNCLERLAHGAVIDPIRATQKALGHTEISSTEKYLSFRESSLRDIVERIAIEVP